VEYDVLYGYFIDKKIAGIMGIKRKKDLTKIKNMA
jgi:hypothetical protein